jgi:hypothetical protein
MWHPMQKRPHSTCEDRRGGWVSDFRESSWFGLPNRHGSGGVWASTYRKNTEGVALMFAGAWCGQWGVAGWVLSGLFWASFLGLVLWAVSRLFAPAGVGDGPDGDKREVDDAGDLDLQLARGQLNVSEYLILREELTSSGSR